METGERLVQWGSPLEQARAAVVLVHGRGATAESMLPLAGALASGENAGGLAFLAPQAPGNTWYPFPFLAPVEHNQPYLSRALERLGRLLEQVAAAGVPPERVLLAGFSQGACLTCEFAARNARRYGGLAGLSGGLIGPPGSPRDYPGSLAGAPVFLGCSDVDPHIPRWRVDETEMVLAALGGQVTKRIYPGMEHTVNEDELAFVRGMVGALAA
jgi:predicted esterase